MEQSVSEQDMMTEDIATQNDISENEEEEEYGPPRGTVAFVALLLIGYVLYYGWHYIEIFVLRGA